jgi:hypothetical protein
VRLEVELAVVVVHAHTLRIPHDDLERRLADDFGFAARVVEPVMRTLPPASRISTHDWPAKRNLRVLPVPVAATRSIFGGGRPGLRRLGLRRLDFGVPCGFGRFGNHGRRRATGAFAE